MKKIATLTLGFLTAIATYGQTFTDDFESYTSGLPLGSQSPIWRTWAGAGGGADDANVVTTGNHTTGGTKSIYFSSTAATGGPQDIVLPFGTSPLNTGQFNYTMWVKIPASKTAYFNFQGNPTMGNSYTLDCWMDAATSSIIIQNTGTTVVTGTIPVNTWFKLEVDANLNTNVWELTIDNISQGTWANTINQIYALDLYPADAQASFWVDDVSFNVIPYTLPSLNAAANLISIPNGLVGQSRNASVKVRNLGSSTINSFTIALSQNGGVPVVQNVSSISLASLSTYTVNITTPFVLAGGTNTFTATVSAVNGGASDGDPADNVITSTLIPVTPANGKVVIAEEGTGTWCGWCPRGAVYMDMMTSKYLGYFEGIAVHNNDPMAHTVYDSGVGLLIAGYPSALVNRLPETDPSSMEGDFLSEIVIPAKAILSTSKVYNSGAGTLDVTVNTTIQSAISGNYKLACVIVEDSVTGTTSGYNQANYYAGGGSGVMGGYEVLANPVPANAMVYDHVARDIQPSFEGIPNAYGTSAAPGATFTHNFTFTIDPSWRIEKMHVVALFIEPSGKINNGSSENAGPVGISEAQHSTRVSLFPNPSSESSNLMLELDKSAVVSLSIYSVNGALMAAKDYGKLNGTVLLPINAGQFPAGMYFVHVTVDGKSSVHKLIKQ